MTREASVESAVVHGAEALAAPTCGLAIVATLLHPSIWIWSASGNATDLP